MLKWVFFIITARKFSGQPGRLPPSTLMPPQPPPPETIERPIGTGAMVARSSDLPYLIVGVVLGSIVLIIVAFIPFCLWRAWSKQSEWTACLGMVWEAVPLGGEGYCLAPNKQYPHSHSLEFILLETPKVWKKVRDSKFAPSSHLMNLGRWRRKRRSLSCLLRVSGSSLLNLGPEFFHN